ncbi:hypothetical protein, partial [Fictibacillus arsenicus]
MTGYVHGASRTAADLRKAGRLIHDLRREIAQVTTERDTAETQLRRTAAQRDLLDRHIEEMRQARSERVRALEIATRPDLSRPPVDYSPGAGSHRLALAAAEMGGVGGTEPSEERGTPA